jgi:hypothetical protein
MRFILACMVAFVALPVDSQVIERKLFDGTVLEFPEGTTEETVDRVYGDELKKRFLQIDEEIAAKNAFELMDIYREGIQDIRINNTDGDVFYSSEATIRMGKAASLIRKKASDGDPTFLVPAARTYAITCLTIEIATECEQARAYLDQAISVFENADAMALKAEMVEQGKLGYRQSNLLAADLFLRAAQVNWSFGFRDDALTYLDDSLRLHAENVKARELLEVISSQ